MRSGKRLAKIQLEPISYPLALACHNIGFPHFELEPDTMKPCRNDVPCDSNARAGSQGAFPDRRNSPSGPQQRRLNRIVSRHIPAEFDRPKSGTCHRDARVSTLLVPVPEAAAHEDDGSVFRQHQIGLSGDALGMQTVAKAQRVQGQPEGQLRLRILPTDPGHHAGTSLAIDDIDHLPPGLGLWTQYTANVQNSRGS